MLAVLVTGGAPARPLTVSIDNRPLQAVAVLEGARVLAPMRAIFEALGASVAYDRQARTIRASTATHTIVLPIGSRIARVDGRAVQLDVPARIVALKTYVPLRFVSQALGAVVGYDARTGLVEVLRGAARTLTASRVGNVTPPNGAAVGSAFPPIGASLQSGPAQPGSIRLTIDGNDVTNEATFDGQTITYLPRTGFESGWHTVAFSGIDSAGDRFERDWRFQTTLGDVQPDYASSEGVPFTFYNNGSGIYRVGDVMHFTLVAPPGGSAYLQLCDLGYAYPFWNYANGTNYEANVPVPYGFAIPSCEVTAVYVGWNGQRTYVPYPVFIGLFTQPVTPVNPNPVLAPIAARRIEPVGRRAVQRAATPPPRAPATAPPIAVPVVKPPVVTAPVVVPPVVAPPRVVPHAPAPRPNPRAT